jgi:signal transduction histidine kinase
MWFSGLSYANSQLTLLEWFLLTVGTILFVTLGFWNLISYTQLNYEAGQVDVSLQRKLDTANRGISVFVHSIKNQLLSLRVIYKKINLTLAEENPDNQLLKNYTDMMDQMNESMLARMDELYRSIKMNCICLKPITVGEIAEMAVKRFHQKYQDVQVFLNLNEKITILADSGHLSEAVYNLLVNAQDAILACGGEKDGRIELITHEERLYTVIEVKDNGIGISKNMQKKIFDPFYTSKNTNSNWGMGLYYVKQIAKSHLGTLRLQSTQNVGTSFFLMLPRYNNPKSSKK